MSRTLIENGTLLDDPFPVCVNRDCIYESEICDGEQDYTGWHPGNLDCIDGSDEEEWFCHGLQVEVANGILNGGTDGSGSGDYWEIDDEQEEDGRLKLKKFEEDEEIVPN